MRRGICNDASASLSPKEMYAQIPGVYPGIEVRGATLIEAGGLGAALRPQWVHGEALVGVQGAKPPETPGFQIFY